mmetsp:Transcript_3019/g.5759  ORF Transcript_3019/g.5759 Transcript_3019/m.5759 type:complete len:677 (-) Transcript_3019:101-2131(-)
MCGIVAYLGSGDALSVLLEGLKRMEYRGYDSAGAAVITTDDKKLQIEKKAGKVINLVNACQGRNFSNNANIGIAHTRWATHGPPSDRNAHPHAAKGDKLAIVHNGIIENYQSLRKKLQSIGHEFKSDTDTEVLAHLIGHVRSLEPELSLAGCVSLALTQVRGAYGIVVIDESNPDYLVGARRGSPLILGVSDTSLVLASDATAVVGMTSKVIYLEDEDLVECRRDVVDGEFKLDFSISSMKLDNLLVSSGEVQRERVESWVTSEDEGGIGGQSRLDNSILRSLTLSNLAVSSKVYREMHTLSMNLETIEKQGYEHFMLKEIMEQPKVLRDCMRGRLSDTGDITLGGLSEVMDKIVNCRRIIICACGTSYHSALVGEYMIESLAKIPVEVEYASEFRYRNPVLFPEDVVIVMSQSGETADTLEAVKMSKQNNCLSIGIVNVVGSSIARETDAGIYLHVGPEIGVASTKAFTGQVMVLTMLAISLGVKSKKLEEFEARDYGLKVRQIPDQIEKVLVQSNLDKIQEMASTYRYAHNFLYLGRGLNFPVALEGALKLKEISYIHAEGYPAAEMKHGPIALIDEMMPVVVIAPRCDSTYEKVKSGIEEVVARNGSIISITNAGNKDLDDISEFVLHIPNASEFLSPMLSVVHLQLLSYYIAKMRGCEIDQPRNLAKSVTVE